MNIIIVGAGEVGRYLAESLSTQAHNLTVIESSEEVAAKLDEQLDANLICGNGASVTTLAEADAAECELFLALTSRDNTNLVSASLAKSMGAGQTISRVHASVQREQWLFDYRAHFSIDYLFSTERLAAVELAKYVRNPEGLLVEEIARGRIELQQVVVDGHSPLIRRPLIELKLPERVRIASLRRGGAEIIPRGTDVLEPGDLVTLFGEPNKLGELIPQLRAETNGGGEKKVVIFGGGEYAFALAQMLEGGPFQIRIMEKNPNLCRNLTNSLQRTEIINGDATSRQQLKEEQIGEADFFIATSPDDEDNVMSCLQAKSLGVEYCLTLIHRSDYADVISENSERLGILGAVSPRVTTNRDLLRFVTSDKYHRVMNLEGGAEVIQVVLQSAEIIGRKIKEVSWPVGGALVAILRGQSAIVPSGEDELQKGDTVYAVTIPDARKALIKLLTR